jgi:hypothetical protein
MMRRWAAAALAAWWILCACLAQASQSSIVMPAAGPMSMATFVTSYLNPGLMAEATCSSGPTAPANGPGNATFQYQCWWDTSTTPPTLRFNYGGGWTGFVTLSSGGALTVLPSATPGIRQKLTGPTTIYIKASGGSDSNDCMSAATACATFAHVMAVITGQLDFGGQNVTLACVASCAFTGQNLIVLPWVGGGNLIFDGGGGSITYTGASPTDCAILIGGNPNIPNGGALPGVFRFQNVTLAFTQGLATSLSGSACVVSASIAQLGPGVTFAGGAGIYVHIFAWTNGWFQVVNSFSVSNGALWLFQTAHGEINTTGTPITVSFTADMNFGAAIVASTESSKIYISTVTWQPNGHNITGLRYNATLSSTIEGVTNLNNQVTTASAGTTSTGGQVTP